MPNTNLNLRPQLATQTNKNSSTTSSYFYGPLKTHSGSPCGVVTELSSTSEVKALAPEDINTTADQGSRTQLTSRFQHEERGTWNRLSQPGGQEVAV